MNDSCRHIVWGRTRRTTTNRGHIVYKNSDRIPHLKKIDLDNGYSSDTQYIVRGEADANHFALLA